MTNSEIYYQAACDISDGTEYHACDAIWAQAMHTDTAKELYVIFFNPVNEPIANNWFGLTGHRRNQHDRFVSLLLMHEIALDLEEL